jgi:rod shape-determining protein MreD
MYLFINILLILLAVVLQISIMPNLAIWQVFPNLILISTVILIFSGRDKEALYWAALGGITLDLFSTFHFGIFTVSLLIIYFLISYLVKKFFSDPNFIIATGLFLISGVIFDLILFIINPQWQIFVGEILYNAVLGVLLYSIFKNKFKVKDAVRIG